jgi:hypothetical protein
MFTNLRKPARAMHPGPDKPHPFVGRAAVFAIIAAMLAIVWAKVEVLGTRDLERTLGDEDASLTKACSDRLEALAFNRWATGFSQ